MNVKRLLLVAVCGVVTMAAAEPFGVNTVVPGPGASVAQYLVALPHIAYGGAWRSQIVIGNTSAAAADVTLNYFDNSGLPLSLAIAGAVSDHTSLTIPAGGQRVVEPDWQAPSTVEGWVGLVYSSAGLKIQGVFLWHNPADPAGKYTQAAAPIVSLAGATCIIPLPSGNTTLTMPFDETGGRFSGFGLANTVAGPVTLNLTFYDQDGLVLGSYSKQFAAFGHASFALATILPQLVGKQGTMVITGQGVVPLGFRFNTDFTFMTWMP